MPSRRRSGCSQRELPQRISHLEHSLRTCGRAQQDYSVQLQVLARQVARENAALRELCARHGLEPPEVELHAPLQASQPRSSAEDQASGTDGSFVESRLLPWTGDAAPSADLMVDCTSETDLPGGRQLGGASLDESVEDSLETASGIVLLTDARSSLDSGKRKCRKSVPCWQALDILVQASGDGHDQEKLGDLTKALGCTVGDKPPRKEDLVTCTTDGGAVMTLLDDIV